MRDSEDFSETVRRGQKAGRTHVVVHVLPQPGRSGSAVVGFVVSRAVGTAVVRNRVKRRLRHLMSTRLDQLPAGSRVVVRALAPSAEASSETLGLDLDAALTRACPVLGDVG